MKKNNLQLQGWLYWPFFSALLIGLSRLPLHTGFLVFGGVIPLFKLFELQPRKWRLVGSAAIFSVTYTLTALHWVGLVTLPGLFGMMLLFTVYYYILFGVMQQVWHQVPRLRFLFVPLAWISFEYLQTLGEFRFPWFNLGYSLVEYLSLIQLADIGGVYLLSGCVIAMSCVVYSLRKRIVTAGIAIVCILTLWMGYGYLRIYTLPTTTTDDMVAVAQGCIEQERKWDEDYKDTQLNIYRDLTRHAAEEGAKLVVWPESAVPEYVMRRARYRHYLTNQTSRLGIDIFTGFPHYEHAAQPSPSRYLFYNSCTRVDSLGTFYPLYYKNILVPVGERMPLMETFPFLWNLHLGQANFEYGDSLQFYQCGPYRYSPQICFEVAFPSHTQRMAARGVDFVLNLTNDAWFHRSVGTYQHAMMAKIRAVEIRRQIYRAANTGISLIVDPVGRIQKKTALFERTTLMHPVILCPINSFFTKSGYKLPLACVAVAGMIWLMAVGKILKKKRGVEKKNG
jgi:apolipoprotein N-acyltransferase